MSDVEVRFAEREGKSIAYKVFGTGSRDLVLQQAWSPIDLMWDLPQLASFLETLASLARVIVYDSPGNGASDELYDPEVATLEKHADALNSVLDAARAPRAVFLDAFSGITGLTFAATYPERVQSLIVAHLRPSFPEVRAMSAEQRKRVARARNGADDLELSNPRLAHDPDLRHWWGRAKRLLITPERSSAWVEWAARMDVQAVLASVQVPTLVLHRRDSPFWDLATSRAAAARIPNARFVELPGSETDLFLGDTGPVFDAVADFLAEPEVESTHDRPLATVLFTDMVASTEQLAARGDDAWRHLLDDHDHAMGRLVAHFRGNVVRSTGDGLLATFDGPARAVRCAAALLEAAHTQGITLRAGLHTGEIELRGTDIAGIAVHIASRIADLAEPDQILVSRTVVDLTAGSGLQFEPRGDHHLKGVPDTWPTFAAQTRAG